MIPSGQRTSPPPSLIDQAAVDLYTLVNMYNWNLVVHARMDGWMDGSAHFSEHLF